MDPIEHLIEEMDISKHGIKASIISEGLVWKQVSFIVEPYGLLLEFEITYLRGTRQVVLIRGETCFKRYSEKLERKLTELLNTKEFVNQLNKAIRIEKKNLKDIYESAMQQSEVEFIEKKVENGD